MRKTINITCSANDNYLQHCMVMLCSVFENNTDVQIVVHMLVDESLSPSSREVISAMANRYGNHVAFYDIAPDMVEGFDVSRATFDGVLRFPMLVYYRLLLTQFLPDRIDTILYLDCDIVVLGSLGELFCVNLNNYGLAAVKDCTPNNSRHRLKMGFGMQHDAFCSGVMVINLNYWRDYHVIQQFNDFFLLDKSFVCLPDQDALNYVFRNQWLQLPYKWGKTPYSIAVIDDQQKLFDVKEYIFEPCIIHYSSSVKPWMDVWMPEKKFYLKYLHQSGYTNTKFQLLPSKLKFKVYMMNVRYVLNKYVHPLIPDVIEAILLDTINIIKLICCVICGKQSVREYLLFRWLKKYQ